MRSRRRTGPLAHVLVAGDVSELGAVRALLALLPDDAYGLVVLEAEAGAAPPDLPRPARIALTVLGRDGAERPGVRLSAAAAAWAEEWVVDEHDPDRDVSVWVGATVTWDAAPVQGQLERL
ncbi:SIP domain-containing protein [Nocardioides pyridinolyticus]